MHDTLYHEAAHSRINVQKKRSAERFFMRTHLKISFVYENKKLGEKSTDLMIDDMGTSGLEIVFFGLETTS